MYIYWDSRRLGARVTVTEGHHNDNEYNGLSSPIVLFTHAWSYPSPCCARSQCEVQLLAVILHLAAGQLLQIDHGSFVRPSEPLYLCSRP